MAAASAGVTSKECGSSAALLMIDFTIAWSPVTALATLPHTLVEATTAVVPCWWSSLVCCWLQPATSPTPIATTTAVLIARIRTPNTNENRFQLL